MGDFCTNSDRTVHQLLPAAEYGELVEAVLDLRTHGSWWVSVTDFGAEGRGGDDTYAFLKANEWAHKRGGLVFVPTPPLYYALYDDIPISESGIAWAGPHKGIVDMNRGTWIKQYAADKDVFRVDASSRSIEGFHLENLSLAGGRAVPGSTTGHGINLTNTNADNVICRVVLKNVVVRECAQDGLHMQADVGWVFDVRLDTTFFFRCLRNGMRCENAVWQIASDNLWAEACGQDQVYFTGNRLTGRGAQSVRLSDMKISVCPTGYSGLYLGHVTDGHIMNGWFEANRGRQISVVSCEDLEVKGGFGEQKYFEDTGDQAQGIVVTTRGAACRNIELDVPMWTKTSFAHLPFELQDVGYDSYLENITFGRWNGRAIVPADIRDWPSNFYNERHRFAFPTSESADSSGTPGSASCPESQGISAIAAGATSCTITNAYCRNNHGNPRTGVTITPMDIDAPSKWKAEVTAEGAFTVTVDAAPASPWRFRWVVDR